MRVLELFVIVNTLVVVFAESQDSKSLCNKIKQKVMDNRDGRMIFCDLKDVVKNKEHYLCYRKPRGNNFQEKVKSHFTNRLFGSFMYFKEAAELFKEIKEKKNGKPQCQILGKAYFQDFQAKQRVIDSRYSNQTTYQKECGYSEDIWKCLNKIPYELHKFHAAHVVSISIMPKTTQNFLSNKQLTEKFCKVSIMSAYTERLPALINQGIDKVFDKWQKKIADSVLNDPERFFEFGDKLFNGYVQILKRDLSERRKTHENRGLTVSVTIAQLALNSVEAYLNGNQDGNDERMTFINSYNTMWQSFLDG